MRRWASLVSFLLLLSVGASGQDRALLDHAFVSAGREFGVPPDLLKAISYTQTRGQHLTWEEGDTASCMGMPRPYGVMALWDNDIFGHTLRRGAELIGEDPDVVKRDPAQNIRAAAALLATLFRETAKTPEPLRPDLGSWADAVGSYTGIRQPDLALGHAYEVLTRLTKGIEGNVIAVPPQSIDLRQLRHRVLDLARAAAPSDERFRTMATPDYPEARWVPGKAGYYYTDGYGKQLVVIHDMEGYYASVLSYFQTLSDGRSVSIHYCVNGLQDSPSDYPAGDVAQMVEEQYYAWHASCLNRYSIGIEHEGFVSNPAWFTPEMYQASARLIKYLCDKYNIPKDRNHLVGHGDWQNGAWVNWAVNNGLPSTVGTCNSHTDPGAYWDWNFLLQLINNDPTPPRVVSTPPAASQYVDAQITLTFDQRMEPTSTVAALRIVPATAGTVTWADLGRTLQFQPSSYLSFDTEYQVTVDSSARNYVGGRLDGNNDGSGGDFYAYTFRTVLRDSIVPSVSSTYPTEGATAISRTAEFIVTFTEQIDQATLAEGFGLETVGGTPLPVTGIQYSTGTGFSLVRFRTTAELAPVSDYRLIVRPTLRDLSGNFLAPSWSITFTTEPTMTLNGTVINTLDAVGSWWQPGTSGSTANVLASFTVDNGTKRSGTGSGKVTYTFTQTSGGVIREHNSSTPSIEGGTLLGAWVFGDKSGHDLRFAAYYYTGTSTSNFVTVSAGPIDWTGWKLKTIPTSSIPVGNGSPRKFSSFWVQQSPTGARSGTLYFDDLTVGSSISDVTEHPSSITPEQWRVHQNYPNPFNPTTLLEYDVPIRSHVRLVVWNSLGQQVAVLVDKEQSPGRFAQSFDASHLPSGLYVAGLETPSGRITRKMLLIR